MKSISLSTASYMLGNIKHDRPAVHGTTPKQSQLTYFSLFFFCAFGGKSEIWPWMKNLVLMKSLVYQQFDS